MNQAGTSFSTIRVRCGGAQLVDSHGYTWAAGNPTNYSVTSAAILNADPLALYQSEAWSTGTLKYEFAVANGARSVKLKFAEIYMTQRGQRVFNIVVNGVTQVSNFDILAYTSMNSAYDVTVPVTVTNGKVTLELVPVIGPVKISGIQID